MKRFFVLLITSCMLLSCSSDENAGYRLEILPVESYIVPQSFVFQDTYVIKLYFNRPTTCHALQGIYFHSVDNVRTIAVQSSVSMQDFCQTFSGEPYETSFNFYVTSMEPYVFRFYKGKDENNNDIYEIVEIPVTF